MWDQTLLWRSRTICSGEKTPVDRSEHWMVSALTQPLSYVAKTLSVIDPLSVPSLGIPTIFLSYPVPYSNSSQNQTSKFRASLISWGLRKVILWCTMTDPLDKETQMWTRIPPQQTWYSTGWNAVNTAQCVWLSPLTPRAVSKHHWLVKPAVCPSYLFRVQSC